MRGYNVGSVAALLMVFLGVGSSRADVPAMHDATGVAMVGMTALTNYVATLEGERREGGEFLLEFLPLLDRSHLTVELFRENLEEAFAAREAYPWTRALPKELFFNDVLPHAVVDEMRDPWRKRLRALYDPHVSGCKVLREAFDAVSSKVGELTGVKYGTNREKACQSPAESMRQGVASCTGLAILMVDSMRAMGVPTRLVAIPMWAQLDGNHTWIEVHDGQGWRVTDFGRASATWDKGWEIARCATCDPENPFHGVFASSYRPKGVGFPTVWNWRRVGGGGAAMVASDLYEMARGSDGDLVRLTWKLQRENTPGIDRTSHYIALAGGRKLAVPKGSACVAVRAFLKGTQTRVDVPLRVYRGTELLQETRTASEARDLNDYARILCETETVVVAVQIADETWKRVEVAAVVDKETEVAIELTEAEVGGFFTVAQRRALADWFRNREQPWPGTDEWPALADAEAVRRATDVLWSIYREAERTRRETKDLGPLPPALATTNNSTSGVSVDLPGGVLALGENRMPFWLVRKEMCSPPEGGRALFLCLHGGGAEPKAEGPHAWDVNTREWQAQAMLAAKAYAGEGLFFVPRMPDDRRGRWWHAHIQEAIDSVIEHSLREWQVDPDRVYILGISEGAYGTLILGPFMADRFAGANAMAGGEDGKVPAENLRNLPLRTDIGENDTTFDRIGLAKAYHARMDAARATYGGYDNQLSIQEGKGHAIDYRRGLPWLAARRRDARPETIVWTAKPLDGRRRPFFYWIGLEPDEPDTVAQVVVKRIPGDNSVDIGATTDPGGEPLVNATLRVLLDDALVDLDREVKIVCNGKTVFVGRFERSVETLARTLAERGDPQMAFPVRMDVRIDE